MFMKSVLTENVAALNVSLEPSRTASSLYVPE